MIASACPAGEWWKAIGYTRSKLVGPKQPKPGPCPTEFHLQPSNKIGITHPRPTQRASNYPTIGLIVLAPIVGRIERTPTGSSAFPMSTVVMWQAMSRPMPRQVLVSPPFDATSANGEHGHHRPELAAGSQEDVQIVAPSSGGAVIRPATINRSLGGSQRRVVVREFV